MPYFSHLINCMAWDTYMVKATLVFSSKFYIVHRTDDLNASELIITVPRGITFTKMNRKQFVFSEDRALW